MADSTGHLLRLADVLAEESFALDLLCGGEAALAREVRGAHAVEVDSPARWLGRDWIMLTTGVRLRGKAAEQRRLVDQLEAGGASALGFGVGLSFKRVPPALLEAAGERGFPVFAVPYATPFREIVRFVDSALAGREEQVFRRITALQRYLLDALRAPQPERALVERLARFLDAGVVLASADGTPEVAAGRTPGPAVLRRICAEPPGLVELEAGDWHAVAAPVATRADPAPRRLVLAVRRRRFVGKLAKPAAEATAPLLAAMARLGEVARDQEQAVKSALLLEALEPPTSATRCRWRPVPRRSASTSPALRGWWSCGPAPPPASWGRRVASWSCGSSRRASRISRTPATARSRCSCRARTARSGRRSPSWRATGRSWRSGSAAPSRRSATRTTRCATRSSPSTSPGDGRTAASCASRSSTSARSWSARWGPSASARRSTSSSPSCAPIRPCTRRSAPTSPMTWTSPRPRLPCTSTATRCATGCRAPSS